MPVESSLKEYFLKEPNGLMVCLNMADMFKFFDSNELGGLRETCLFTRNRHEYLDYLNGLMSGLCWFVFMGLWSILHRGRLGVSGVRRGDIVEIW